MSSTSRAQRCQYPGCTTWALQPYCKQHRQQQMEKERRERATVAQEHAAKAPQYDDEAECRERNRRRSKRHRLDDDDE